MKALNMNGHVLLVTIQEIEKIIKCYAILVTKDLMTITLIGKETRKVNSLMSYKLSILVPGIRNENWLRLYHSVAGAFSGSWEIIFAGPYDLPAELEAKENVQYIQTWRCPIAAQQMCLVASRGELISWAADDGFYLPGTLDISVNSLENEPYTTIVVGKYIEGNDPNSTMTQDWYYTLYNHDSMKLPGVPKDALLLNCGVVHRSLLIELGGWDAGLFEICPMAYTDFSIRAYRFGCKFILQQDLMFSCSHEPDVTGTHEPIHLCQIHKDQPRFNSMNLVDSIYLMRQTIDIGNWKKSAEKWSMRFKN